MSNTMNSVVDNLANRFDEVANPAMERIGEISQTLVQETARLGFTNMVVGLGVFCLSIVCVAVLIWVKNHVRDEEARFMVIFLTIIGIITFSFAGFAIAIVNLGHWIAPTKKVVMELLSNV